MKDNDAVILSGNAGQSPAHGQTSEESPARTDDRNGLIRIASAFASARA
jgi:hypothetical protein